MTDDLHVVVLAAGQGKRMRSRLPKVLHRCGELPLVAHVVRLALARGCAPVVVVVDPQGEPVKKALSELLPGRAARVRDAGEAARHR